MMVLAPAISTGDGCLLPPSSAGDPVRSPPSDVVGPFICLPASSFPTDSALQGGLGQDTRSGDVDMPLLEPAFFSCLPRSSSFPTDSIVP